MRCPKKVNLNRFAEKSITSHLGAHSNHLQTFFKPNKPDSLWFLKTYLRHERVIAHTKKTYAQEAFASDLYRFILGKDRAAKARVVRDEHGDAGIISQKNPAGFEPFFQLRSAYQHFSMPLNAGRAEVEIAEDILDESDGLSNPRNSGLNYANHVTRIDYDYSFNHLSASANETDGQVELDKRLNKLKSDFMLAERIANHEGAVSSKRFYTCQLRTILLTKEVLHTIANRHMDEDDQQRDEIISNLGKHIEFLYDVLLNSAGFYTFLMTYDTQELNHYLSDFFKSEMKQDRPACNLLLLRINHRFADMRLMLPEAKSPLPA